MQANLIVGADVAGRKIDFAVDGTGNIGSVANERAALQAWLATWPEPGAIAMESTGRHHGLLAELAYAAGWQVYVLNALDASRFRASLGMRGKTDRNDAQAIARMLAERHSRLRRWAPTTPQLRALQVLLQARARAVKHLGAMLAASDHEPALSGLHQQLIAVRKQLLAQIDAQIAACVSQQPAVNGLFERLQSIIGVGSVSGAALAALFTRVPFANADAVVAFVGLDPRPNDSGQHHGKRHITKRGSGELRRLVFLMGAAAARSKALNPLYAALRQRRTSTEAILILGRKLLRVAFAMFKSGQPFDVQLLLKNQKMA